jgi:hypothetical protein
LRGRKIKKLTPGMTFSFALVAVGSCPFCHLSFNDSWGRVSETTRDRLRWAGSQGTSSMTTMGPDPAEQAVLDWTPDLPISGSDQAGLVELQVIHIGRDGVTDHPSVRIRSQQLMSLVQAG